MQYVSLRYDIYNYAAFEDVLVGGHVDTLMYQKFIRGTIDLMASTSQSNCGRYPKTNEIKEMAKSIAIRYPILRDKVFFLL